MLRFFIFIVFSVLFFSCAKEKDSTLITIDPADHKQFSFSEIVSDYKLIKLEKPEGVEWGQVNSIKKYGEYIFIVDRFQTKTVTAFDKEGNFIKQLDRAGDSPGDYTNLSLFTFDPINNAMVVYSRMQGVNIYEFETLELQKEIPITDRYFMGFECLANNQYFAIKEYNSQEDEGGYFILDENFDEVKELQIPNYNASIEISYPSTVSRTDNSVLYNFSSDSSKIYELSEEGLEVKYQLNFGNSNIDSKDVWNSIEAEAFEKEVFMNKKATFIQFFREGKNDFSFWFINGEDEGQNNLATYNKNTLGSKVIRKIYIGDADVSQDLYPMGIFDNQYVTVLNAESDLAAEVSKERAMEIKLEDDYLFVYEFKK